MSQDFQTRDAAGPGRREILGSLLLAGLAPSAAAAGPTKDAGRDAAAPKDFDFLVGHWDVRHRRLKARLAGNREWIEFGGTLVNWTMLAGLGNVGDNLMRFPAGPFRGIGLRTYDPEARLWSSWWVDGRTPTVVAPAMRGAFSAGVGEFTGDDLLDGRAVKVRVRWSRITAVSARWEQAFSGDGGVSWETNWTSDFRRMGA